MQNQIVLEYGHLESARFMFVLYWLKLKMYITIEDNGKVFNFCYQHP